MLDFIRDVLKISNDGVLNVNELIVIAIAVVVVFLILAALKNPLMKWLDSITPGRKKTIFSHRKNQYKNRIGKRSKTSKKKR